MTFYLKGHQNYHKSKLELLKKFVFLSKMKSLNLQTLTVFILLEIKCHTAPHLKALTRGIVHTSEHWPGSAFKHHYPVL